MALTDKLTAIGDAIRAKTGKSEKLTLDAMATEISSISAGGGGGESGYGAAQFIIDSCEYDIGKPLDEKSRSYEQALIDAAPQLVNIRKPYLYNVILDYELIENAKIEFTKLESVSAERALSGFGSSAGALQTISITCLFPALKKISGIESFFQFNNRVISDFPELESITGDSAFSYSLLYTEESIATDGEVTNYSFPKLKSITGKRVFYNIYNNGKLALPAIEGNIPDNTFSYSSLSCVDLGANLAGFATTSKYSSPTSYAKKLTALIIRATTVPELKVSAKDIFNFNCPLCGGNNGVEGYIYVPKDMITQYESATNWTTATGYFRAIEDYPEICGEVA